MLVPEIRRPLTGEELLLLASVADQPQVTPPLKFALANPGNLRLLYDNRARLANQGALAPLLVDALRSLIAKEPSDANHALLAQLATGFKLSGLETELITAATKPGAKPDAQCRAEKNIAYVARYSRCGCGSD